MKKRSKQISNSISFNEDLVLDSNKSQTNFTTSKMVEDQNDQHIKDEKSKKSKKDTLNQEQKKSLSVKPSQINTN